MSSNDFMLTTGSKLVIDMDYFGIDSDHNDEDSAESFAADPLEVEQESMYYRGKDAGCIDTLQKLLQTSGIWSVKAAKQLFKLQAKQNNFTDAMFSLQSLLGSYHHHSANDALIIDGTIERILGSLLDDYFEPTITALLDDEDASEINLVSFLEGSLLAIQTKLADSCERIWLQTSLLLARFWVEVERFTDSKALNLLKTLREHLCMAQNSSLSPLLTVLALEMRLCAATGSWRRLRAAYAEALALKPSTPLPPPSRVTAAWREIGGRMHFEDEDWQAAYRDFFEAFKAYDEVGHAKGRLRNLKYLMLCALLQARHNINWTDEGSVDGQMQVCLINPLESPEARPYREVPEIGLLDRLLTAFVSGDVGLFEQILNDSQDLLKDDSFLKEYLNVHLGDELRLSALERLLLKARSDPKLSISLENLAAEIKTKDSDHYLRRLLSQLIQEGRLEGGLMEIPSGQPAAFVWRTEEREKQSRLYKAIQAWTEKIEAKIGEI